MDAWAIWLLVGCALAIGEALTLSFFLAPFAVGALTAGLVSAAGAGDAGSWVVFVAISLLCLFVLRPIAIRHQRRLSSVRDGAQALVGTSGLVVEEIGAPGSAGAVRLGGEVWTARAADEQPIAAGTRVQVLEISGATAVVSE